MDATGSAPLAYDPYGGWSSPDFGDGTVNNQSADWGASSVQPAAGDWGDVLKYGFSRLVDAKVRSVRSDNAAPVLQSAPTSAATTPLNAGGSKAGLYVVGAVLAAGALLLLVKR
jgi:hypothetical protein